MNGVPDPVPVAFCITDLDPGGAERALVQIVRRLDRREWAPEVFCLSKRGELADVLEAADIPVTCFNAGGLRNLFVVFRLARQLRRQRPAVLQTFLYHANIVGRIAARLARVPHVVSGIRVAERRSRFRLWIDRWTQWMVSRHICVSNGVTEFSVKRGGLDRRKILTIPNGVDYEHFAHAEPADLSELGIAAGHHCVISVGRLDPQKDPHTLLQAFATVAPRHRDWHLLFVGDGPMRSELETQAAALNVEQQVHFAGRVVGVAPYLKRADCFALASRWEGMPNAILEAMAAGIPVVATNVEGSVELIESGKTGILVEVEETNEFSSALEGLISDDEARSRIGLQAQHVVMKEYTWDAVVSAYVDCYQNLIGGRSENQ